MIVIARFKQIIEGLLDYVQKDFTGVPEQETLLYQMFYGVKDGGFDFYRQAKLLFTRNNDSPRKLSVRMEYPKDKANMPCIIIREPSRSSLIPDTLGGIGNFPDDNFGSSGYEREGYTHFSSSNFSLMCFSDNMLESILIGEVIYALLMGVRNTLEQEFTNFDFSMSELIAENSLFPTPILIKNIEIKVDEEQKYPSIIRPEYVKKFIIQDAIVINEG